MSSPLIYSRTAVLLLAIGALPPGIACAQPPPAAGPSKEFLAAGDRALEWTRRFVELGPRPAGSVALDVQHKLIVESLSDLSCAVEVDSFVAPTPIGALRMRSIIARFGPPAPAAAVVVSGHYDTYRKPGFVGANDGGSSAGLLMALAERLHQARSRPVWLVFFDGEESTQQWRNGDHTYGSRNLAARWTADGTAQRLRALINVDMIGDENLRLVYEGNSDVRLREAVWTIATKLGYASVFSRRLGFIEDDHIPFVRAGVPSLNLIDFDYGPGNAYWHTTEDAMDKLDAGSFAIILHVLDVAIQNLLDN